MIFLIFFKDDEDLDNGWKGSAGSWEDPPSAPSYIWSLSAPSYMPSLLHMASAPVPVFHPHI